MYPIWGKTITSSDHLVSHIDNVLRQQDGFEATSLTYFYKEPDGMGLHYIMFLKLKDTVLKSTYVYF